MDEKKNKITVKKGSNQGTSKKTGAAKKTSTNVDKTTKSKTKKPSISVSKTDKSNTKIDGSVEEKETKQKRATSEIAPSTQNETKKEYEFIDEAKESIFEGAKIISEEAKYLEKLISSKAGILFKTLKGKTAEVIDSSNESTRETYNKALSIFYNYKDKQEIKKLLDKKRELTQDLGLYVYLSYTLDKKISEDFFNDDDVKTSFKNISNIEQEIIKKADQNKKHE